MVNQASLLVTYDCHDFSAPIEYTFALIFSIYGIDCSIIPLHEFKTSSFDLDKSMVISYGKIKPELKVAKQVHIYAADFFGEDFLKPASMPKTPLQLYDDLPVIYHGHGQFDSFVKKSENLIETNIDIIASSFFMLSRYEEMVQDTKDQHERFPAKASLAYQERFLHRPIVNEYIELLWSWIQSLEPGLKRRPFWPGNKDFAFCLTHDVDSLKRYSFRPPLLRIGYTILKRRKPRLALAIALDYLFSMLRVKKDPFDTFDYMLSLERAYGFKSSFYFKSGGDSIFNRNYSIAEPKVIKLIKEIEERGCEVGLHAGYNSYDDLEKMALEKARLDKIVGSKRYGCRQHVIRWKTPNTWRIQERLGLLYDTSLTFADHTGFRCGICLPFKPFDVMENRELNIWELPLTVMEGSLQNPNYQNLPPEAAYEEMLQLVNMVKKFKGVFVLLWHNSSFDSSGGWKGWKEVYEKLMEYVSQQAIWGASGREIIEWWSSPGKP